jgi:Potential Queuosine, Q, salvage protein family
MSDDEADPELLELLRKSLGLGPGSSTAPPTTRVLESAEYVCNNSIDVAIDMAGTKAAAHTIWKCMQARQYSTHQWSEHELHPRTKDENTVNFIFAMDLLNFSFWSDLPQKQRFAIEYKGKRWTGYWSLVAALQRALDESEQDLPQ